MASDILRGKRCFITGAASGIGRAAAVLAGAGGAELLLTDVDRLGLERTVAAIRAAGGNVAAHRAFDIADRAEVQAFADEAHASAGSVDVVMNVAGISIWGTVEDLEHAHWRKAIEVDLMGPIHVIEAFVPTMIRAGRGGHLVNVSSAAGLLGLPFHAAYSAAKFGLRGISEVLRFDLEPHGIAVSLVCPGAVNTGLVETVELVGIPAEMPLLDRMKEDFRRRAVTPEAAAAAILRGIERKEYLVFTSWDVKLAYLLQTRVPFLYERAMRQKNRRLRQALEPHRTHALAAERA